jgi:hypothetical protein
VPSLASLRPDVPESVEELFAKLLAKKPSDRPASADEVVQILSGSAEKKWNATLLIAGGIAIAVILFLLGLVVVSQWNR